VNQLRASVLALAVAAVAVLTAACGTISPYAAKVNADRLSQRGLEHELDDIAANTDYVRQIEASQPPLKVRGSGPNTFDPDFVSRVLTRQIFYRLVRDELVKRRVHVDQKALDAARQTVLQQVGGDTALARFPARYRTTLVRRQAELELLTAALAGSEQAPQQDPRAFYEANRATYDTYVCASHILVTDKAKADALEARLAGGADFAELARTESIDNQGATGGSAAKGGDLGCVDPSGYIAEFAAAVKSQPVGQIGPPVQTQFGYHIIKVTARPPTYEQLLPQVEQQLAGQTQQQGQAALNKWLQDAVKQASITINPRYGTFSRDPNTFGVVASKSGWQPSWRPTTTSPLP
jgi:parvulin-like peptidyl-prolyl isomerase